MEYSRAHMLFLQGMLSRHIVSEEDAKSALVYIYESEKDLFTFENDVPKEVSLEELNDFIKVINDRIRKLDMEIKHGICEVMETSHYALINTVDRPIAKYAIYYNKNELQIFQKVLGEIVVSEEGGLSSIACMNLDFTLASQVTKREIERIIEKFVNDGWFVDQDGMIHLGIRSILEMEPFLRATYKDSLNSCSLCKLFVFKGEICDSCSSVFHLYCLRRFLSQSRGSCCPNCNAALPEIDNSLQL